MAGQPRILVVKLSAIGDCLHATPAVRALRQSMPEAHIGWAVHQHCSSVINNNEDISKIHRWDRKRMLEEFFTLRKSLRRENYSIAIDLQGLFKSGLITKISGAKRRIGRAEAREFAGTFYTEKAPSQAGKHIIDQYLGIVERAGAKWESVPNMVFPVTTRDQAYARVLLTEPPLDEANRPIVVLNPSAGKVNKQWPPEAFARLADSLIAELDALCLVTGAPNDGPLGEAIVAAARRSPNLHNIVGRTSLHQLAGLLSQCNLFVGGDTGPMHIAQAVGCPVLALFGPTDPKRNGPREPQHRVIYKDDPEKEVSMHKITADEVFHEAKDMLKGTSSSVS